MTTKEKIEELERRIKELEMRPPVQAPVYIPQPYPVYPMPVYPIWPTYPIYPTYPSPFLPVGPTWICGGAAVGGSTGTTNMIVSQQ